MAQLATSGQLLISSLLARRHHVSAPPAGDPEPRSPARAGTARPRSAPAPAARERGTPRRRAASGSRPSAPTRSSQSSSYGKLGMSLMWMPAQTTDAAAGESAQRRRHELARRREDDRRVELLGPGLVRRPGPLGSRARARTPAASSSPGRDEAEHAPALVPRDLRDDVRRRRRSRTARAARHRRPGAASGSRSARRRAAARPAGRRSASGIGRQ